MLISDCLDAQYRTLPFKGQFHRINMTLLVEASKRISCPNISFSFVLPLIHKSTGYGGVRAILESLWALQLRQTRLFTVCTCVLCVGLTEQSWIKTTILPDGQDRGSVTPDDLCAGGADGLDGLSCTDKFQCTWIILCDSPIGGSVLQQTGQTNLEALHEPLVS